MTLPGLESLRDIRWLVHASRWTAGGLVARARAGGSIGERAGPVERGYVPGDDYRAIDWNVCARHDELVWRRPAAAADRRVYVLLDCSRSMATGRPPKFDAARRAAISTADTMRAEQKAVSKQVSAAAPEDRPAVLARAKELAAAVKAAEGDQAAAEAAFQRTHLAISNVVIDGVPAGGEDDFVVLDDVQLEKQSWQTRNRWINGGKCSGSLRR